MNLDHFYDRILRSTPYYFSDEVREALKRAMLVGYTMGLAEARDLAEEHEVRGFAARLSVRLDRRIDEAMSEIGHGGLE